MTVSDINPSASRELMRRLIPGIVLAFTLIGVIGMLGMRANAARNLQISHELIMPSASREIAAKVETIVRRVAPLSTQAEVKAFAQSPGTAVSINPALRDGVLTLFLDWMNQNADDVQALRYVNRSQTAFAEVRQTMRGIEIAQDQTMVPAELLQDALQGEERQVFLASPQVVKSITQDAAAPNFIFMTPVKDLDGTALGVIQAEVKSEVLLEALFAATQTDRATSIGRRLILLNGDAEELADTHEENQADLFQPFLVGISSDFDGSALYNYLRDNPDDLNSASFDNSVVSTTNVDLPNLIDGPWRLVLVDDANLAFQETNVLSVMVVVLAVLAGLAAAFLVHYVFRRILRPFEQAARFVNQLDEGGAELELASDNVFLDSITQMAGRVKAMTAEMEAKRERLRDDLEIAARISGETLQHADLNQLLTRTIDLICGEQRFHHAQIFLVDAIGENLVLAQSHGGFGQTIMNERLRIPVHTPSIVSRVLNENREEVDNNLHRRKSESISPLAPHTRSRLVLPLRAGDVALGVLDIQSIEPDTFLDEELHAFVLLANQISTSIYNIRLLQESNDRVQEINILNRELTRTAWEGVEEKLQIERSYHYDLQEVTSGDDSLPSHQERLDVPITIRGEVVGSLEIAMPEDGAFSTDDQLVLQAVTDRVALAIDRARLFQETQLSLSETSLLYDLSRRINEATELEDIIQALIASVMLGAIGGQIMEFDEYPIGSTPVWMRVRTDWAVDGRDWQQTGLAGSKFHVPDYLFLSSLNSEAVRLIPDLDNALDVDEELLDMFHSLGANALAVIPLVMRGVWRGLIIIEFAEVRRFTEKDRRVYTALIDQAGIAIDNSLLLRQTEATLNEISRLYAASSAISSAPDLYLVYLAAAEHLSQASFAHVRIMFLLAEPEREFDAPYLEYSFVWDGAVVDVGLTGTQVPREQVPYARMIEALDVSSGRISAAHEDQPDVMAELEAEGIHSVIVTPLQSRQRWFGMLVCVSPQTGIFDDQFRQFVQTVGDQVAIAVENHDLIRATENERESLSSILGTMPSGVLVLDAQSFLPVHINAQIEQLLGRRIDRSLAFTAADYNLYRTGTQLFYADEELPTAVSRQTGELAFADDIVTIQPDGSRIDLLLNAAPIRDSDGEITMIVASFENISSLRGLENALQDNLRETIALYEATRTLTEADQIDDVLDVVIAQLEGTEPHDGAIILLNENSGERAVVRTISGNILKFDLPEDVFNNRATLLVDDVARTDTLNEAIKTRLLEEGILAFGSLPLRTRARDLPLAWMMVTYAAAHHFSSEEERYITTLADSAATALDNRYLFQSTELALQEASILYQASRAITAANDPHDVLNAVLGYLIHGDVNHVFLVLLNDASWDAPGATADVVANWNGDDTSVSLEGVTLLPEHFPAWPQLAAPELLVIPDMNEADDLSDIERIGVESLGTQSLVVMPLRVGIRMIGAIWMGSPVPHVYTDREIRTYQAFAEQTAISINASQLFDQAERRAGQLQTSSKVSQAASSILELDLLLPRLVDLIKKSFNYDHVQIFLMDREDRFAVLRASTGDAGRQLLAINHKLEKGSLSVIGSVTSEGRPIIASDTGLGAAVHKPNPYLPHTRSEMALPLAIKGRVVGALDVQSNFPNAFKEEDVSVLSTLAAQISVAIENARLFEQSEHRANDMTLLFDVTKAAAAADTLTDALQNVAADLRDSLQALSVGIYLPIHYLDEVAGDMRTTMRISAIAGYDEPLREIEEVEIGDANNVVGQVAQSLQAQIIDDVFQQPEIPAAFAPVAFGCPRAAEFRRANCRSGGAGKCQCLRLQPGHAHPAANDGWYPNRLDPEPAASGTVAGNQ